MIRFNSKSFNERGSKMRTTKSGMLSLKVRFENNWEGWPNKKVKVVVKLDQSVVDGFKSEMKDEFMNLEGIKSFKKWVRTVFNEVMLERGVSFEQGDVVYFEDYEEGSIFFKIKVIRVDGKVESILE